MWGSIFQAESPLCSDSYVMLSASCFSIAAKAKPWLFIHTAIVVNISADMTCVYPLVPHLFSWTGFSLCSWNLLQTTILRHARQNKHGSLWFCFLTGPKLLILITCTHMKYDHQNLSSDVQWWSLSATYLHVSFTASWIWTLPPPVIIWTHYQEEILATMYLVLSTCQADC